MKKILILGAGEMQIPIIQKAREMNLYTIVVDFDENAPGFEYADIKKYASTNDFESVLQIANQYKISGILTTSDLPVKVVAKVAKQSGLSAMSEEVSNLCTNKFLQREFLRKNNIKTPEYYLIKEKNDLESVDVFPCVIKPIDSSASRGVKKVENKEELKTQYDESVKFSKLGFIIIEEFIEGREFSVESFSQNGTTHIVAITEKLTKGEEDGFFVEDTHIIPAKITEHEKQLIIDEIILATQLMEMNNCPAHTEIKLNEQGAYIIEIACRLGGDYITSDLVPLSTGVDMLENLIKISLGEKVDLTAKWDKVAAIQFLNGNNYNKCIEFINTNNTSIIRSEIKEYHQKNITSSLERMGYIILNTNSGSEINKILTEINN